jgi:hypothetical protein
MIGRRAGQEDAPRLRVQLRVCEKIGVRRAKTQALDS